MAAVQNEVPRFFKDFSMFTNFDENWYPGYCWGGEQYDVIDLMKKRLMGVRLGDFCDLLAITVITCYYYF